jgi:hypothetical protein
MGSQQLIVSPSDGEVVELVCKGRGSALAMFNTIFRRNSYLDLHLMTSEEREELARIAKRNEPPPPRNLATGLP